MKFIVYISLFFFFCLKDWSFRLKTLKLSDHPGTRVGNAPVQNTVKKKKEKKKKSWERLFKEYTVSVP